MRSRRVLAALLIVLLPLSARASAPNTSQAAAVQRYLHALARADYDAAYAQLSNQSRRYYGNEKNYASWFRALHADVRRLRIVRAAGNAVDVEGLARLLDVTQGRDNDARFRARFTVLRENGALHIEDRSRPRKIVVPASAQSANGVRAIAREVAFYPRRIALTVTLVNTDSGFATFLPYNKTVLTDQTDTVYPLLVSQDWNTTDKALFLGMRLAGNAEYTGVMNFRIPGGANPRELHVEIAPVVREGGPLTPFALTLPAIATGPA